MITKDQVDKLCMETKWKLHESEVYYPSFVVARSLADRNTEEFYDLVLEPRRGKYRVVYWVDRGRLYVRNKCHGVLNEIVGARLTFNLADRSKSDASKGYVVAYQLDGVTIDNLYNKRAEVRKTVEAIRKGFDVGGFLKTKDGVVCESKRRPLWWTKYQVKNCSLAFDQRFNEITDLRWLPWVGDQYKKGGVLVIGESNYVSHECPEDTLEVAKARVDNNRDFTRIMAEALGCGNDNRTFRGIAECLDVNREGVSLVWQRIAYVDVVQKVMRGSDWKMDGMERPDFKKSGRAEWGRWLHAVLDVINVLQPALIVLVGCGMADQFLNKRFVTGQACRTTESNGGVLSTFRMRDAVLSIEKRECAVKCVPNPGGAHGFSAEDFRPYLRDAMPHCWAKGRG